MKLTKREIRILLIYLILSLLPLIILSFSKIINRDITKVTLFVIIFVPALSIHGSPLGISMRKWLFGVLWILISLILYTNVTKLIVNNLVDYKLVFSRLLLMPFIGYFYHQVIRLFYKLIFHREPIVKSMSFLGGFDSYCDELKRDSDLTDRIFTVISFLGFMFILIYYT
jgi:hypothetical protein